MEIYGYSERGAMNALFYGMALDKEHGEESMRKFIKELAKIEGNFTDFKLYNEFSLSEFGDPDFMITAKNKTGEYVVFFIEAKASCCKYYNIEKQQIQHEKSMNGEIQYKSEHSSNLFFQLRLKHYFSKMLHFFGKPQELETEQNAFFSKKENGFTEYGEYLNRFKNGRKGNRKIGENVVVEKIVNALKDCKHAYYIAIIPKQNNNKIIDTKEFGFETHTITWEQIYEEFKKYLEITIKFNQGVNEKNQVVNQILNEPIK